MNDDTVCQWITDEVCSGLVLFIHKTEERRDSASEHPALYQLMKPAALLCIVPNVFHFPRARKTEDTFSLNIQDFKTKAGGE